MNETPPLPPNTDPDPEQAGRYDKDEPGGHPPPPQPQPE